MEENEFDKIVASMAKPVKYEGIDGFFAVIAVLIVLCAVPIVVLAWRVAF